MMNKTCPYCSDSLYNCDYCDNTGDDFEPSSTGYHHIVAKGF